ncbi:hypothetical protein ILUMI_20777 [Ignelater luminosus]|uniref:Uncharacterized protein n=1 Tax=Ignelater luminosus TaxID=2038154 RepID=A0A8K0CFS4_IGNLU|nr:hypothetical protein ILUMI_20777 [Ignelater luminosus]
MAKGDAKSTIQHVVKEGRRRTTVSRIIKRYKDTGKTEYALIPGRPISKQMLKTQKKIETLFTKCPTTSLRIVAKKLNIPKSTGRLEEKELGQFSYYEQECIKELHSDKEMLTEGLKQLYMPENNPDFIAFMEFHFYVQGAHMDAVDIRELAEVFAEAVINHYKEVGGDTSGQEELN